MLSTRFIPKADMPSFFEGLQSDYAVLYPSEGFGGLFADIGLSLRVPSPHSELAHLGVFDDEMSEAARILAFYARNARGPETSAALLRMRDHHLANPLF